MKITIVSKKFSKNNYIPVSGKPKDLFILAYTTQLECSTDSSPFLVFNRKRH